MKKYLIILFLAGCTQKQPESILMGATYTTYVTTPAMTTAINNAVVAAINKEHLTIDSLNKRITKLESNQQAIFDNISELFKRTDNLQKHDWHHDSLFNISDTTFYNKTQFLIIGDTVNLLK